MAEQAALEDPRFLGFGNFAELRRWHARQVEALKGAERPTVEALRSFVTAVQSSGANITAEDERLSAQDILDYWAAELISAAPTEMKSWSPPRLDAPGETHGAPPSPGQPGMVASKAAKERIRLAASARLWRDSGFKAGYLLFGQALADAKPLAEDDPDIAALVKASEKQQRRNNLAKQVVLGVAVLALVATTILFAALWRRAEGLRDEAVSQRGQAVAQREEADKQRSLAQEQRRQAQIAEQYANSERLKAQLDRDIAQAQMGQLEQIRQQLDAALALIGAQLASGALKEAQLPSALLSAVGVRGAQQQAAPASFEGEGYAADFLGPSVPLPKPQGGADPLNYPNFSITMSPKRRLAMVTATNIDRQRLRVLPQTDAAPQPDPRIPTAEQPDPAWFGGGFNRAHLVTRQEIAWGPALGLDDAEAPGRLTSLINVYTNLVPQSPAFNNSIWSGLNRWIMASHNPRAVRLTVLSGPVLDEADPVIGGAKVPRSFWKIAVSQRTGPGNGLIVDAFLVPQFLEDTLQPNTARSFAPDLYRTSVADIEQAAGLDFGLALRQADAGTRRSAAPANGWADRAALLNAPSMGERRSAAESLIEQIRDPSLPDLQRRDLVAAVASLGAGDDARKLSPSGRVNMLLVLSQVPKSAWDRQDWIDAKASVRRMIADLESKSTQTIGPTAAGLIGTLKSRLDWDAARGITVYFQYAGLAKPDAQAITADLKSLGWTVPGEEMVPAAKARNGVYYTSPDDLQEATLLAADLRAQGQRQVNRVERIKGGKAGTLEVWVSQ